MQPAQSTRPAPTAKETRRVAGATLIGTSIEWFDFFVYGAAAALVFGKLFFPTANPLTGTLLALSTFGVGFIARPFGGVIFAHFGDRIGRKSMLVLSVVMMGGGTFLVGLLPTYETIGIAAPIILVLLRIVQGIGLGGEWGAAAVMAVEYAPPSRRGFFGSFPQTGVPAGMLLANLSLLIVSAVLSDEAFLAWGWRVPFLASIVLVVVGIVIRLKVAESPVFEQTRSAGKIERQPVIAVLRRQPLNVLRAAGLRFAENSTFYIHTTFVLTYGTLVLGLARSDLLLAVIISSALGLVSIPFYGWACDKYGRRPVVLWGSVVLLADELAVLLGAGHPLAVPDRGGDGDRGEHRQLGRLRAAAGLLLRAVRAGGALQRGVDRGPGRERVRRRAGSGDRHRAARRDRWLGLDRGLHVGDGADHDRHGAVLAGPVPRGAQEGRTGPGVTRPSVDARIVG